MMILHMMTMTVMCVCEITMMRVCVRCSCGYNCKRREIVIQRISDAGACITITIMANDASKCLSTLRTKASICKIMARGQKALSYGLQNGPHSKLIHSISLKLPSIQTKVAEIL